MHTYRDALDGVRSVRVLYPGELDEFHEAGGPDDGVGAVALRPGGRRLILAFEVSASGETMAAQPNDYKSL